MLLLLVVMVMGKREAAKGMIKDLLKASLVQNQVARALLIGRPTGETGDARGNSTSDQVLRHISRFDLIPVNYGIENH